MAVVTDVKELLVSNSVEYTPSGRDYLIKCLNPEHIDVNPSLRIDKITGVGHCFSCGYRVNLFKYFGIVTDYQNARVSQIKEKIQKVFSETYGLSMPKGWVPFYKNYRNISADVFKTFEAFTVDNQEELENRVVFPLKDANNKIIAFIGRHFISDIKPRYRVYPGGVELPLFPSKLYPVNGTLVLVEGIFDALNLIDKGIPNVAAMLGTQSLYSKKGINKEKTTLLKLQGITKLVLLLDGDPAGIKAAQELQPLLEKENFFVSVIDLPENMDPGDLSVEEVAQLKRLL